MKKRICSLLLACLIVVNLVAAACGTVLADSGFVIDEDGVLEDYYGPGGDVVIPDGVTSIGADAFLQAWLSLTSVRIPDSVTSIGAGAFSECYSLTRVSIGNGVTSIEDYAFSYCTSLISVSIPDSVTSIGNSAFAYCTSLMSVEIPDSVTSIGGDAFENCTSLTSVSIPGSVTNIGDYAFYGCDSLTSVVIPNSVTRIELATFQFCVSLTSVSIPDSVTSIGGDAFYGCTSLTSVIIPNSVTSIEVCAFENCTSLSDIYYSGSEAEWNAIDAFSAGNNSLLNATIHYNSTASNDATLSEPVPQPSTTTLEDGAIAALEAEEAIADAATMSVSGGAISLNSLVLSSIAEQGAAMVAAQESALGDSLERSLRNTVKIITDTTDITVNVSETVRNTSADRVRIETPDYFITLNVAGMDEDFTNSNQYTIKVTEVELDGISPTSLVTEKGYSLLGVRTAEKTLSQKATRGNRGVKVEIEGGSTTNPITVGLKAESGDTTYQAIVNVDTGDATASKYNTITEKIEGKVTQSGTYAVAENEKGFSDIAGKSAEMQKAIKYLASKGIISGTSSTTFSPDNSISRAEIAALILRALGKNSISSYNPFSDVTSSNWYFSTACSSYKLGIINGYDDGTFRGGTAINKVQIVAVSARVLKSEMKYFDLTNSAKNKELAKFSDTIESWAQADVALASFANLVVQRSDGLFAGSNNMTRGDAAVVIYRLFEKLW